MDQQQLGERLGGLERGQQDLDRRMGELQRTSTVEHGEVKSLLTAIRDDLAKKADKAEVADLEKRTDATESFVDNWKGRLTVIAVLVGLCTTFAVGFLLNLTGGG